jgi:two-component system cell cycle response regulator
MWQRRRPMKRDMTSAILCDVDELTAVVEGMEHDRRTVDQARAEEAGHTADAAHRPDLAARARLIVADAMCRQGDLIGAAPLLYDVLRWATENGDRSVQARAHFHLSNLHTCMGDSPDARRHALHSVDLLPDDASPNIRGNHLIVLALAVETVSRAEAARYHAEALDIAAATGDDEMSRSVLNNLAYGAYQAGDGPAAAEIVQRMYRVVARSDAELRPADLDTIARVEMLQGRYLQAERILLPLTAADVSALDIEGNMMPEVLLTIAEAQRRRGAHDDAQPTLDRCLALCTERGLAEVRVRALREQARLYADQGRFREAYAEQCRHVEEDLALRSAEREAQARLAQVVFESREGRRETERFREMALRDALTGLYNRRFVDTQLPLLLSRVVETARPLSIALIDVDFFKRINDTFSHEVGDVALQRIAGLLAEHTEDLGTVARFGGEEFVLVMPGTGATAAEQLAERIRVAVEQFGWTRITGELPVTVSIGLATTHREISPAELLAAADQCLYAAKRGGRNRVTAVSSR